MTHRLLTVLTAGLLLTAAAARAEIFVSSNDGKQFRADDTIRPEPDTVSVIDVTNGKVKLLGSVAAPVALTGPPNLVAVTRDSRLAIVTSSQKLNGQVLVPDDRVSVIDVSVPSNPRLLQTVQAGSGASGVDISPDGKLVLVASTADDAITLFSLANKKLTRINQIILEKGSGSTDVMFLKDGKTALAVGRMNFRMMLLSVSPTGVAARWAWSTCVPRLISSGSISGARHCIAASSTSCSNIGVDRTSTPRFPAFSAVIHSWTRV